MSKAPLEIYLPGKTMACSILILPALKTTLLRASIYVKKKIK